MLLDSLVNGNVLTDKTRYLVGLIRLNAFHAL
jgi:hypothetical protein